MEKALRGLSSLQLNNNMNTTNEYDSAGNRISHLGNDEPEFNEDVHRWDRGGLATTENGIADRLLQNDTLYNELKGDWSRTDWNLSKNIKVTIGRDHGQTYMTREQMNIPAIQQHCKEYRERAEAGFVDPLAPLLPDGKIGYKWMELPEVIAFEISNKYFGGLPWQALKRDRNLKAQFYKVVETEYNAFVCYPGGKLPIPVEVPYPAAVGSQKFFAGTNYVGNK